MKKNGPVVGCRDVRKNDGNRIVDKVKLGV